MGGGHARGVWLTHGQWHVGIGPSSKGSQECGMQVGALHKKGCIEPYREAQGKVGGQGGYS